MLVVLKFISWSIYLGSGTSGGTLAPLFTIGGGLGALLGDRRRGGRARDSASTCTSRRWSAWRRSLPARRTRCSRRSCSHSRRRGSRSGCCRCSPAAAPPICVSLLLMRSSIMTEKLARRGTQVRTEYTADFLDRVLVRDAAVARRRDAARRRRRSASVREWLTTRAAGATHQGFPVIDATASLVGVVTRRDLLDPECDPTRSVGSIVGAAPGRGVRGQYAARSGRPHGARERRPAARSSRARRRARSSGILSRSDLLDAHRHRLDAALVTEEPPIGEGLAAAPATRRERVPTSGV